MNAISFLKKVFTYFFICSRVLSVVACFLFVTRIPWKVAAAEKARLNALVTTLFNRLLDKGCQPFCGIVVQEKGKYLFSSQTMVARLRHNNDTSTAVIMQHHKRILSQVSLQKKQNHPDLR